MGVIADLLARCHDGAYPHLIASMPSGFAVLNEKQPDPIRGCCMLIPKNCVGSINDLPGSQRAQFLSDMALLGDAIMSVTDSKRINYLVLCNQAPELHAHCIPRFESEDPTLRLQAPFQAYDFSAAPSSDPFGREQGLIGELQIELKRLLPGRER